MVIHRNSVVIPSEARDLLSIAPRNTFAHSASLAHSRPLRAVALAAAALLD